MLWLKFLFLSLSRREFHKLIFSIALDLAPSSLDILKNALRECNVCWKRSKLDSILLLLLVGLKWRQRQSLLEAKSPQYLRLYLISRATQQVSDRSIQMAKAGGRSSESV